MSEAGDDDRGAGIRIAPPLIFGGALALGLAAGNVPQSSTYGTRARRLLGTVSIAVGVAAGASEATGGGTPGDGAAGSGDLGAAAAASRARLEVSARAA